MQQLPPYGRGEAIRRAGLLEAVLAAIAIFCAMAAEDAEQAIAKATTEKIRRPRA